MRTPAFAALAVFVPLASCAPVADGGAAVDSAAAGPGRQCFSADQVRNFRAGGAGRLYVRVIRGQVFELNSSGGCTDLDFANQIAITPDVGALGGSRICTGDAARITLPAASAPVRTCRAWVSRQLTEAEVSALPAVDRP